MTLFSFEELEKCLGRRRWLSRLAFLHEQVLRGRRYTHHPRTGQKELDTANISPRRYDASWVGNNEI